MGSKLSRDHKKNDSSLESGKRSVLQGLIREKERERETLSSFVASKSYGKTETWGPHAMIICPTRSYEKQVHRF